MSASAKNLQISELGCTRSTVQVTKTSHALSTTTGRGLSISAKHVTAVSSSRSAKFGTISMTSCACAGACWRPAEVQQMWLRLIFNHLEEALSSQPAGTATEEDASLPLLGLYDVGARCELCNSHFRTVNSWLRNPLRFGKLCGKSSCFEL